jgi:hypothetical protein
MRRLGDGVARGVLILALLSIHPMQAFIAWKYPVEIVLKFKI